MVAVTARRVTIRMLGALVLMLVPVGLVAEARPSGMTLTDAIDVLATAADEDTDAAIVRVVAHPRLDPWLIAEALCHRRRHAVAVRFIARSNLSDEERSALSEYVDGYSEARRVEDTPRRAARSDAMRLLASGAAVEALARLPRVEEASTVSRIQVLFARARVLRALERHEDGGRAVHRALEAAAALGWGRFVVGVGAAWGVHAFHRGDFVEAERYWKMRAAWASRTPNGQPAGALHDLAYCQLKLGKFETADASVRDGLRMATERKQGGMVAKLGGLAASMAERKGDFELAIRRTDESITTLRTLGDLPSVIVLLANSASYELQRDRYRAARERLGRARQLLRELDAPRAAMHVDLIEARLHARTRRYVQMYEAASRAERIARSRGDRDGLAIALREQGAAARGRGAFEQAEHALREAMALARDTDASTRYANTVFEFAKLCEAQGRYAEALRHFQIAVEQTPPDSSFAASVQLALARMQQRLGDMRVARTTYRRVVEAAQSIGARVLEASAMSNLALIAAARGDLELALKQHRAALEVARLAKDRMLEANTLGNIGRAYQRLGRIDAADAEFERARAVFDALDHVDGLVLTAINRSVLAKTSGQGHAARKFADRAYRLATDGERDVGRRVRVRAAWVLADVLLDGGEAERAAALVRDALGDAQRLVGGLADVQGARARETWIGLVDVGLRAAVSMRDASSAISMIETLRAGALREALDARSELRAALLEPEVRAQLDVASLDRDRASEEVFHAATRGAKREARRRLKDRERQLLDVIARTQRDAKRAARVLDVSRTRSGAEIRRAIPPGTELVLYARAGTDLVAVVSTSEESRLVELGEIERIRRAADAMRSALTERRSVERVNSLGALIVDPLGLREDTTHVVLSPIDALCRVPLAMWLEGREVSYTPSASVFATVRAARERGAETLGVGHPEYQGRMESLPATKQEIATIATVKLVGGEATVEAVRRALATNTRWRAIHFACHGVANLADPLQSSLALSTSDEGVDDLSVLDIMRLSIDAALVTLSACDTALGAYYESEGVFGLVRAFLYAGADEVIGSLWRVDDDATAAFMQAFYRSWTDEARASHAIRAAQDHVRSHARWSHPYYWAAWTLWGRSRASTMR